MITLTNPPSLIQRLLIAAAVVCLLGGIGIYVAYRHVRHERDLANQEALNRKRADSPITVVEGKRREEIAALLESNGICSYGDFLAASASYEGKLFPDTYRFFPNTPASEVVKVMTDDFSARLADSPPTDAQLKLASIVERESLNDEDRAAIAGVYANRLAIGMTLDADPTVQYAKDNQAYATSTAAPQTFKFWKPITQADYRGVVSPYNTYLNAGLPPTPIGNPGKASILAAEHPQDHDYYYFLYRDKKLLLSKTLLEHEAKQ